MPRGTLRIARPLASIKEKRKVNKGKWKKIFKIIGYIITQLFLVAAMILDAPNSALKYIAFVLISGLFAYMTFRNYIDLKRGR